MADIKDIKLGNTKYNIKIPSSRVKSMADYAKPSSKPSPEAIQQSDTLNAAFGKLEYKADTNQTNILYSLQTGVKNLFNPEASGNWQHGLSSYSADAKTGTISIAVTASDWARTSVPIILPAGEYKFCGNVTALVGSAVITGNTSSSGQETAIFNNIELSTTGTFEISFTLNAETPFWIAVYANFSSSIVSNSVTITGMMICTKAAWDQEPNVYRPFALPNSDLTGLQAEDRAALAEVVDSGEKNHLENIGASTTQSGVVFTVNDDLSVTLSTDAGGATARAVLSISNGYLKNNWVGEILSGVFDNSPAGVSIYGAYSNDGISETSHIEITNAKPTDIIANYAYVRFFVIVASGTTLTTATTVKPMLCDTVVYAVSPAYVPFKRFYLPAIQKNNVTSGSIDDVKENTFACYSSNVTNLPTTNDFYVETTIYKSYLALQRAYRLDSPRAYIRVKNSNVWSTWSEITNA